MLRQCQVELCLGTRLARGVPRRTPLPPSGRVPRVAPPAASILLREPAEKDLRGGSRAAALRLLSLGRGESLVFQRSCGLVLLCGRAHTSFPAEQITLLWDQLRSANARVQGMEEDIEESLLCPLTHEVFSPSLLSFAVLRLLPLRPVTIYNQVNLPCCGLRSSFWTRVWGTFRFSWVCLVSGSRD